MTSSPIKVSIMIPTYNRAGYLDQAVASALAQTYAPLEVVVSDNASADETPQVALKYASDPRVRWNRNPSNIGLAGNWEKILYELVTGDYVKLLTDDDYLTDPEHISKAVRLIESGGLKAVFSGGQVLRLPAMDFVDQDMRLPPVSPREWWLENFAKIIGGIRLCPSLPVGAVFERKAAMGFGAFRNTVFGTDLELSLQFLLDGPTGYLAGHHWVMRDHTSNDGKNAQLDVVLTALDLYGRFMAFGRERKFPQGPLRSLCRRVVCYMIRWYVVPSWVGRYGWTLPSWFRLCRRIARVDFFVALATFFDPIPFIRAFLGRMPASYAAARAIYRGFNRSLTFHRGSGRKGG